MLGIETLQVDIFKSIQRFYPIIFAKLKLPLLLVFPLVCVLTVSIALSLFSVTLVCPNDVDFIGYLTTSCHAIQDAIRLIMNVVYTVPVNFRTSTNRFSRSKPFGCSRHTRHEFLNVVKTVNVDFKCVRSIDFLHVKLDSDGLPYLVIDTLNDVCNCFICNVAGLVVLVSLNAEAAA